MAALLRMLRFSRERNLTFMQVLLGTFGFAKIPREIVQASMHQTAMLKANTGQATLSCKLKNGQTKRGNNMTPLRKEMIQGNFIEEYYWDGKVICYVNHKPTKLSFDVVVNGFRHFEGIEAAGAERYMDAEYAKALDSRLSNGLSEDED